MNLNEFSKNPRLIKNPDRYMKRLAKRGKLSRVYKNQNVNAHQATDGEIGTTLRTYKKDPSIYGTGDDNLEATNDIQQGDYIVNNTRTPWQTYVTKEPVFNKKYRPSEDEEGVYIPKGEDMMASPYLRRGVHFKPQNWGGYDASVSKGGRMMQSTKDPSDIYPIQQSDFDGTYAKRLTESQLDNIIRKTLLESIAKQSKKRRLMEFDDFELEDAPEFRPQGSKYFKYRVIGHIFNQDPEPYKKKVNGKMVTIKDQPYADYPEEEFDNLADAIECAKRFEEMPNAVKGDIKIKGFYHTLSDDEWEYIYPKQYEAILQSEKKK